MAFGAIWRGLRTKHPELADPAHVVSIRSDNLYSLLEQVYEKGVANAKKTKIEQPPEPVGASLFNQLFGR
jgi:hypothetical protein